MTGKGFVKAPISRIMAELLQPKKLFLHDAERCAVRLS